MMRLLNFKKIYISMAYVVVTTLLIVFVSTVPCMKALAYSSPGGDVFKEYTMTGTIQCMSIKDRIEDVFNDHSLVKCFSDENLSEYQSPEDLTKDIGLVNQNYNVAILQLDNPMIINCPGFGSDPHERTIVSVNLCENISSKESSHYNYLQQYSGKHVTCTIGVTRYPSQASNGVVGDVFGKMISVYPDQQSSQTQRNADGEILFNDSWMVKDTNQYINELAEFCGNCSEKIEDDYESINGYLQENSFSDYENTEIETPIFHSSACTIGHKTTNIDGQNKTILLICCRGTKSIYEMAGDWGSQFFREDDAFLNTRIYHNIYEFEEHVFNSLVDYADKYNLNNIDNGSLKVVVTGHSLGGAAANAVAAKIDYEAEKDSWWLHRLKKSDVYAYTFGAIKTLGNNCNDADNIYSGFENIHNLYNWSDSFGPYGSKQDLGVSVPNKKFGHTETFDIDKHDGGNSQDDFFSQLLKSFGLGNASFNTDSHNMPTYLEAISKNYNENFIALQCGKGQESSNQNIAVQNIPKLKDLESFLAKFQEYTGDNTASGGVKRYDCDNPTNVVISEGNRDSQYNILFHVIYCNYPCVNYSIYPISQQKVYEVSSQSDPLGKFQKQNMWKYSVTSQQSAEWILKNIFNVSESGMDSLNASLSAAEDKTFPNNEASFYNYEGDYYAAVGGGRGGFVTTPSVESATYDGKYYNITYRFHNATPYGAGNYKPIHAKMELKDVDGSQYWSIYSLAE